MENLHFLTNIPRGQEAFELAQQLFEAGDLTNAASHVGYALSDAPWRKDWQLLLDQIIESADDPLSLVPVADGVYFTDGAVFAYTNAKIGNLAQAIATLGQVIQGLPDNRYMIWVADWVKTREDAKQVPSEVMWLFVNVIYAKHTGVEFIEDEKTLSLLKSMVPAMMLVWRTHPVQLQHEGMNFNYFYQIRAVEWMLEIAQAAYDRGDLYHDTYLGALQYLAGILAVDPTHKSARALLDRIIAENAETQRLINTQDGLHYSTGALLAYIYANQGSLREAFSVLSQVVGSIQDDRYLPWFVEWVSSTGRFGRLPSDEFTRLLIAFHMSYSSQEQISEEKQNYWRELLPYAEKHLPTREQPVMMTLISKHYRLLEEYDQALEYAQEAYQLTRDPHAAVFLAGAYRSMQDFDKALEFYKEVLQMQPQNVEVMLDIADINVSIKRLQDGLEYYKMALALDPENSWAKPHYLYYDYLVNDEVGSLEELREHAQIHPEDLIVQKLLENADTKDAPYFKGLPAPTDATINAMLQLMASMSDLSEITENIRLTTSALESPSAMLSVNRFFEENGLDVSLEVTVLQIPQPDPRYSKTGVEYFLWEYEGTIAKPALGNVSPDIKQAIAAIAKRPYDIEEWEALGQQIVSSYGKNIAEDLLAVMVNPPETADDFFPWAWLQRVQFASALTIASLDDGWDGSLRKKILFDLANGPMDWTVTAAIVTLTHLALLYPDVIEPDVLELFEQMVDSVPDRGAVPYWDALFICVKRLPGASDVLKAKLFTED